MHQSNTALPKSAVFPDLLGSRVTHATMHYRVHLIADARVNDRIYGDANIGSTPMRRLD
jgi:hypothetical protein